jgi:hypothetical protein
MLAVTLSVSATPSQPDPAPTAVVKLPKLSQGA